MPDSSNVLNIPCTRCNVGWMQITADPRTLEPVELHCSNCKATAPLPPALVMRDAGVDPLPGFD
jgi:hypothetical protein